MELLTFEGNFCDIICCENTPGGSYCESDCSLKQIWERLKEYEDSGLSPAACAQARRIEDVLSERDSSIDIMVELMVAYEAGRIVVLPKSERGTCGNCENFERIPGSRSGTCKQQYYCKNRYGQDDKKRGRFMPAQSHKSCKKYKETSRRD